MDICKNMESLIMKNCYGIDFRSWRKELRTREKTKQTPCKLPDRVSRSLQGVLFKVNAARKSKVDDNTARMQSIKQLGV